MFSWHKLTTTCILGYQAEVHGTEWAVASIRCLHQIFCQWISSDFSFILQKGFSPRCYKSRYFSACERSNETGEDGRASSCVSRVSLSVIFSHSYSSHVLFSYFITPKTVIERDYSSEIIADRLTNKKYMYGRRMLALALIACRASCRHRQTRASCLSYHNRYTYVYLISYTSVTSKVRRLNLWPSS